MNTEQHEDPLGQDEYADAAARRDAGHAAPIGRLLDRLLGPRCPRCRSTRVFPRDAEAHARDCS